MTALELARPAASTFATVEPAFELAGRLAKTEFVPAALRGRPEAIMATILAGVELGIDPMVSLRTIHIIEGRPTLAAEIQRALIRRDGHRLWTSEYTSRKVTLHGVRIGQDDEHVVTWEIADAERAGIASKQNWRRYPRQMLFARATSEIARLAFSDVTAGMYAPEDFDVLEGIDETAPAPGTTKRRRPARVSKRREIVDVAAPVLNAAATLPVSGAAARAPEPEPAQQAPGPPLPGEPGYDDDEPEEAELVDDTPPHRADVEPPRDTTAAQRLAIHAAKTGLDDELRHDLIELVTEGRTSSANDLGADELAVVRSIIDDLADGTADLAYGDDGRLVLTRTEPGQTTPASTSSRPDLGATGLPTNAAEWRLLATRAGMTAGGLLLAVMALAGELGIAQESRPADSGAGLDAWLDELGPADAIAERLHRELTTDPPF